MVMGGRELRKKFGREQENKKSGRIAKVRKGRGKYLGR